MREREHDPSELRPRRYLGLELSGAKNQKTALAAIEYYPREKKIFLLDIYDKISGHEDQSSDEALLEIIHEELPTVAKLGVNVPLELPPCIGCTRRTCPLPQKCSVPAVKWMREAARRIGRHQRGVVPDFTPYTQRPVELHVRYSVLPMFGDRSRLEIDETLGGNKGPLTARMNFLRRHLSRVELAEVSPKLTISLLGPTLGLSRRTLHSYRQLEDGVHARSEILDTLVHQHGIFVYDRDMQKLSRSLPAFDAFFCAYTAMLSHLGHCAKTPAGFPTASGWIEYPK